MTLEIEHVTPDSLVPAPYNPRTMTEDARARLRRGIEEFGLVDPIIARRSDRLVVGGHQRLTVAKELGLPLVPVVFLDDLNDQRAAALNILLNNPNAQGSWHFASLTDILSNLESESFDVTLTGFDSGEIERMLTSEWNVPEPGGEEQDSAQEATVKVRCRPADVERVRDLVTSAIASVDGARLE